MTGMPKWTWQQEHICRASCHFRVRSTQAGEGAEKAEAREEQGCCQDQGWRNPERSHRGDKSLICGAGASWRYSSPPSQCPLDSLEDSQTLLLGRLYRHMINPWQCPTCWAPVALALRQVLHCAVLLQGCWGDCMWQRCLKAQASLRTLSLAGNWVRKSRGWW